ncbi:putative ribose/galactose/methyl galactoside import ATP-binding protein [Lentibacillus sp. JNUCC-1]|uniref:ABC transporter ATP-binding protein n=1 Tax=Lentibacillus sp. JNUCC-1 TaxID=2654513 RepID=UPI0012E8B52C|nr:ABC transporter ATP-binding protein [Lentibacillus sp. JNUCC-1]MUV36670.1 putative ribose/galactose/methyl galactoside import ATP-binding protein [Lentibacillus sp. JNUCC-1]
MLELIEVSKRFKKNQAVKNVSMFIERGEIIGLLGPNGAGKSTTISILSSLIEPTNGDVRLFNNSILKSPGPIRKVLGIVPQEIALYTDLTASENLKFFGKLYKLSGQVLKERVTEVLNIVGLTDKQNEVVKTFSGGMKRRLNIGVGLMNDPELLVMDEPTVGIDPQSRKYILETVKRLNKEKGVTILYTSHYMEEVEFLCDRIYIMDQGNLIASGTTEEIKHIMSAEKTVLIRTSEINDAFLERLNEDPTIQHVTVEEEMITALVPRELNLFPVISHAAEETQTELMAVTIQSPTLEDVFLHLTGRALRD